MNRPLDVFGVKVYNAPMAGVGLALLGVGGLVASPADETLVTAGTGGLGLALAPIQGPATAAGGLGSALVGAGLLYLATRPPRRGRR